MDRLGAARRSGSTYDGQPLLIDAFGLLALTEFVTLLTRNGGLDR